MMKYLADVRCGRFLGMGMVLALLGGTGAWGQEDAPADAAPEAVQDDVSKALDSTATQWSFQFAWQHTDWKDDKVNGQVRPEGLDNFAQIRIVAPLVYVTVEQRRRVATNARRA